MVGGRSHGCRTCKQRKIKCDLRTPICGQCQKSKRYCPGPDGPFRYQYGSMTQRDVLVSALRDAEEKKATYLTLTPTTTKSERLSQDLFLALCNRDIPPGNDLQSLSPLFEYLPVRVGYNEGLDASLRTFLFSHQLINQGRSDLSQELEYYTNAITSVRRSFNEDVTSETIAAAILLYSWEILRPEYATCLSALTNGVAAMFDARGPMSIKSSFDLALFEMHYPTVLLLGLIQGTTSLFCRKKWVRLIENSTHPCAPFYVAAAKLGNIFADIRRGDVDMRTQSKLYDFRDSVRLQKFQLHDWRNGNTEQHASTEKDLLRPAAMYCSFIIMVNMLLLRIGTVPDEVEIREATEAVVAMLGRLAKLGTYGSLHFTLSGPLAWGVATAEEKVVILESMSSLPTLGCRFGAFQLSGLFLAYTAGHVKLEGAIDY